MRQGPWAAAVTHTVVGQAGRVKIPISFPVYWQGKENNPLRLDQYPAQPLAPN